MPQAFIKNAIIKKMRSIDGYRDLRVLDLSCGRGEILFELLKDGCNVRGTHFRDDDYKLVDADCLIDEKYIDKNIDLTRQLPYQGGQFDVVILSEVIEHLNSSFQIIREIERVLKTGGFLILSTPNIHRIHSRWHFFLTGTHKLIQRRIGWDLAPNDLYAYHINPVDFPLLHTLMYQSGLTMRGLTFTRFKPKHSFWLLFYPIFILAVWIETHRRKSNAIRKEGENDLFKWMIHPAMLASEQLLITAQKNKTGLTSPGA
jgi:2-polyprenyl-3-methyl-5-hydroxy-6-metoxy-1,4-benzoquinol methylase